MGKRGPAPKPTRLRQLDGNAARRPINDKEPKIEAAAPRAPAWLADAAKADWRRLVKVLDAAGMLTAADRDVLAMYCNALAEYRHACELVEQYGRWYESDKGNVLTHPAVTLREKALAAAIRLAREIGLSPSARVSLKVDTVRDPADNAGLFAEFHAAATAGRSGS